MTRELIERERELDQLGGFADSYYETLAVYRAIAEQLPLHGRLLAHASAVAIRGRAFAFMAKSGPARIRQKPLAGIGRYRIVRIDKQKVLAARGLDRPVAGSSLALVLLMQHAHVVMRCRERIACRLRPVIRAVICEHDLELGEDALRLDRLQASREVRSGVVYRADDADIRHAVCHQDLPAVHPRACAGAAETPWQ